MLKKILIGAALLLAASPFAFCQGGFRIGDAQSVSSVLTTSGAISTVPNSNISICTFPANAVPCTNRATTYTSSTLGTPCSTSTQIVLAGTSTCVATTDSRGNWGAWVPQGNYDYTIQLTTGQAFGPFTISVGIPSGTALSLGNLTVTGTIGVSGAAALNGGLTVNGGSTLNGGEAFNGGGSTSGSWTHSGSQTWNGPANIINGATAVNNTLTLGVPTPLQFTESGGLATLAGADTCGGDSIAHALKCSFNADGPFPMARIVASGTSILTANAALGATTSQAVITTAASGTLTTDAIEWSYASAPGAGDSLCIVAPYVTANNVNFVRSNPTAGAQNVSAIVINWKVVR